MPFISQFSSTYLVSFRHIRHFGQRSLTRKLLHYSFEDYRFEYYCFKWFTVRNYPYNIPAPMPGPVLQRRPQHQWVQQVFVVASRACPLSADECSPSPPSDIRHPTSDIQGAQTTRSSCSSISTVQKTSARWYWCRSRLRIFVCVPASIKSWWSESQCPASPAISLRGISGILWHRSWKGQLKPRDMAVLRIQVKHTNNKSTLPSFPAQREMAKQTKYVSGRN